MSMPSTTPKPRLLTLLFVTCSIGSLALSWHFHHQLTRQQSEHDRALAKAKQDYDQQIAKAKTSKKESRSTPKEGAENAPTADAKTSANSEKSDPAAHTGKTRGGDKAQSDRMTAYHELMNSPEVMKLMALQQKGELDGRFAELFKKLKLSPAKLDELKHLLAEQQSISRDVFMAARQEGMGRDDRDEIAALIKVTRDENDASIRQLLGDDAYNDYANYNANATQRKQVDRISDRLSYSEAPLSEKQSEQLVQLLAQTSKTASANPTAPATVLSRPGGGNGFVSGLIEQNLGGGGGVTITDQVIGQASTFMSTTQIQQLRQLQTEQQAQAMLRKTFSEVGKKNTAPAPVKTPPATVTKK